MDRKIFESIKQSTRKVAGKRMYESMTGRTPASVQIAKDWLQALKDIVANKVDPLEVIAQFDKRIDAEVAKGDLSDIYAHIRQQMPDTTDLGLIAANIQSIEDWLKQNGRDIDTGSGKVNEVLGLVSDAVSGVVNAGTGAVKGVVNAGKGAVDGTVAGVKNAAEKKQKIVLTFT